MAVGGPTKDYKKKSMENTLAGFNFLREFDFSRQPVVAGRVRSLEGSRDRGAGTMIWRKFSRSEEAATRGRVIPSEAAQIYLEEKSIQLPEAWKVFQKVGESFSLAKTGIMT